MTYIVNIGVPTYVRRYLKLLLSVLLNRRRNYNTYRHTQVLTCRPLAIFSGVRYQGALVRYTFDYSKVSFVLCY